MKFVELKVEPCSFSPEDLSQETIEGRLATGFSNLFSYKIAEFLASDKPFDPLLVKESFISIVNQDGGNQSIDMVVNGLWGEASQYGYEYFEESSSILHQVGQTPDQFSLNSFTLPSGVLKRLRIELHSREDDFSQLSDIHSQYLLGTGVPFVLRELLNLKSGADSFDMEAAHKLLREALNSGQLDINPNNPEALIFLTYLPTQLRYFLADPIFSAFQKNTLEKEFEPIVNKQERQVLELLKELFILEAFVGDHWMRLREWDNDPEDFVKNVTTDSCKKLDTLSAIKDLSNDSKITDFIDRVKDSISEKKQQILSSNIVCEDWMAIDIGHGMYNLYPHAFFWIERSEHESSMDKDGRLCVVFEDSLYFQDKAKMIFEPHTPFVFPDENAICDTPESFTTWISNNSVGLFVLDMHNRDDKYAGQKIAVEIIKNKLNWLDSLSFEELQSQPVTHILIWSSSTELCKMASSYFNHEIENDLDDRLGSLYRDLVSSPWTTSNDSKINIKVNRKGQSLDYFISGLS